jgi:Uma2 family endonuclease
MFNLVIPLATKATMKNITDINQLDFSKSYTYADYLTWKIKERVELIMGKIRNMSPAPTSQHQQISIVLSASIFNFLKGKKCKIFTAPFDVRLPIQNDKGEPDTVVQPDISVICDTSKIDQDGCNGAPDLIVEIISKSSVTRDLREKFTLYEQCGVREYWIVHPNDKSLSIFILNEKEEYVTSRPLTYGDNVASTVLHGVEIDLHEAFQDVVKEPEEGYLPEGYRRL